MLCTEKKGIFDCTKLSLVTSRGKTKRKNTISQVFFNKQYFNALHTTMQLEFPKPIRIVKEWIRILLFQNIQEIQNTDDGYPRLIAKYLFRWISSNILDILNSGYLFLETLNAIMHLLTLLFNFMNFSENSKYVSKGRILHKIERHSKRAYDSEKSILSFKVIKVE